LIRAAIQLNARHAEAAVEELKPAIPYERAYPLVTYQRALSYLAMKSALEAAGEFQKVLERRYSYIVVDQPADAAWTGAHVGLARARALAGDKPGARKAYEDFFALWKDADSNISLLQESRKEYASLQ